MLSIVLDSNIIINDYYMKGAHFRVLLDRLPRLDALLTIPEVVLDESVNRFREEIGQLNELGTKYDRLFERLCGDKEWDLIVDAEERANSYRHTLLTKIIPSTLYEITPYPIVTHRAVVSRALSRLKPFDSHGRNGYRDALIWETILGLLRSGRRPLYFVTMNSADFGEAPQFHGQLRRELLENGFSLEMIKLYSSVAQLNEALVLPKLPHRQDLSSAIQNDRLPSFSLMQWSGSDLLFLVARKGIEYLVPLDPGHAYVDFATLFGSEVKSVSVDGVLELTNGNLLLSATIELALELVLKFTKDQLQFSDVQKLAAASLGKGESAGLEMTLDLKPLVRVTLILEVKTHRVLAETLDEVEVQVGPVHKIHSFQPHPMIP